MTKNHAVPRLLTAPLMSTAESSAMKKTALRTVLRIRSEMIHELPSGGRGSGDRLVGDLRVRFEILKGLIWHKVVFRPPDGRLQLIHKSLVCRIEVEVAKTHGVTALRGAPLPPSSIARPDARAPDLNPPPLPPAPLQRQGVPPPWAPATDGSPERRGAGRPPLPRRSPPAGRS